MRYYRDYIAGLIPEAPMWAVEQLSEELIERDAKVEQLTRERDEARAEVARLQAGGCTRDQRTTQYCAEAMALQREVERLTRELDETRREAAQWQESCGQNYVRATEAEMALEKVERERDEARAEVERLRLLVQGYMDVLISHIDGINHIEKMHPDSWHMADIKVRRDGADWWYEGDWLKDLLRVDRAARAALEVLGDE